ncbi:galanin-like G-protein coupled receptor npr-9, partial [Ruditapes philippinarum]|uniref:galanin-like G-protein coupled receptor npr-9 n=1 Tax=Ruditapes philippinarum TaxID=129788 RepID=UPI00295AE7E6
MNITNVTGSDIPEWLTVQQVVFSGIIVLVGIPGNILIILTFAYSPGKSSTDYMVFSMGISDLLGSAVCAPFNLLRHIPVVWASLGSKWFCRTYDFFAVLTGIISSWILGLVAFDRYMKTCRPFSDVLTTPRTKLLCV